MNKDSLQHQLDQIARVDEDVRFAVEQIGYPAPRNRPQGLETLLSIIVSQQLSTGASASIMQRLRGLLPQMTAPSLLALSVDELCSAGLSARKVEYARNLASAIVDGSFEPQALPQMDDATTIEVITSLRGFGRWSAQIYLMFSLDRQDVFPRDDLALLVALQRLKKLDKKPAPQLADDLITHWAPYRTAGSLFLWHYYRGAPT